VCARFERRPIEQFAEEMRGKIGGGKKYAEKSVAVVKVQ